jgi:hypothetical protein
LDKRGRISYDGRSAKGKTNDSHVRHVTYAGRSAKGKTPYVLRQAQDNLRQGIGEETGRMPVQTDKQDAYATCNRQGACVTTEVSNGN